MVRLFREKLWERQIVKKTPVCKLQECVGESNSINVHIRDSVLEIEGRSTFYDIEDSF